MAKTVEKGSQVFTKEQLVKSKKYMFDVDLVAAILDDNKKYSIPEVDAILQKFKEGKVR